MSWKRMVAIGLCLAGTRAALGQNPHPSVQALQDPGEAAVLAACNTPPAPPKGPAPGQGAAPQPARDYTIMAIPGVIVAGQKWKYVWGEMGNNGDGIMGAPDGGLLVAQNDNSEVVKLDLQGRPSVAYIDTHTGGALTANAKGAVFIVERGLNPRIAQLAPVRKTLADKFQGEPLDCQGVVLNDLTADSKDGVYFTMGLFYAEPTGNIKKFGDNLHTNGIVLSPDEKTLYVTSGPVIESFAVQPDGWLSGQKEFAKLEGGGNGDGSTVDEAGRLYVTSPGGVQVIGPEGTYLGMIPTPRPVISVAFSGPEKKTLYILARGAKDADGKEVANAAQVYAISMIAQGFRKRAK